jgi:hypothetical protein
MFGLFIKAVDLIAKAVTLVEKLGLLKLGIDLIKDIGKMLMKLAKSLDLVEEDENLEDFGDKALQAEEAGIKLEKFDSVEDYVKTVSKMKLDPALSLKFSPEEKAKKATEVFTALTMEKYGTATVENLFKTIEQHQEYFTAERTGAIGDMLKNGDKILDAINGIIGGAEKNFEKREEDLGVLADIEKIISPDLSDADALKKVVLTTV